MDEFVEAPGFCQLVLSRLRLYVCREPLKKAGKPRKKQGKPRCTSMFTTGVWGRLTAVGRHGMLQTCVWDAADGAPATLQAAQSRSAELHQAHQAAAAELHQLRVTQREQRQQVGVRFLMTPGGCLWSCS